MHHTQATGKQTSPTAVCLLANLIKTLLPVIMRTRNRFLSEQRRFVVLLGLIVKKKELWLVVGWMCWHARPGAFVWLEQRINSTSRVGIWRGACSGFAKQEFLHGETCAVLVEVLWSDSWEDSHVVSYVCTYLKWRELTPPCIIQASSFNALIPSPDDLKKLHLHQSKESLIYLNTC